MPDKAITWPSESLLILGGFIDQTDLTLFVDNVRYLGGDHPGHPLAPLTAFHRFHFNFSIPPLRSLMGRIMVPMA